MRKRHLAFGLGLIGSVAFSLPANAQSSSAAAQAYPSCEGRTPSESDTEAAHKIYLAGKAQYDASDWAAAIAQFREAYRRDCTKPEILINLSRAYEFKGDKQEALNALQAFLDRVPPSHPDIGAVRARMANIQKQIDAEKKAGVPPPPIETKPTSKTEQPKSEQPQTRGHTVAPWVVAGIGGAAIIAGVVVYATKPKMPANCSGGSCYRSPDDESDAQLNADKDQAGKSRSQSTTGLIVGGAGIVVLAGGLIWHFLEHPNGSSASPNSSNGASAEKPTVTPAIGPGFAGLSFGGTF
ncbi:MAG: tetratricopeptide repeat protein [Polyangiaceae bacterium]|nr:tetratricopeptide repeat protein [Polyangiaceae bacterium]